MLPDNSIHSMGNSESAVVDSMWLPSMGNAGEGEEAGVLLDSANAMDQDKDLDCLVSHGRSSDTLGSAFEPDPVLNAGNSGLGYCPSCASCCAELGGCRCLTQDGVLCKEAEDGSAVPQSWETQEEVTRWRLRDDPKRGALNEKTVLRKGRYWCTRCQRDVLKVVRRKPLWNNIAGSSAGGGTCPICLQNVVAIGQCECVVRQKGKWLCSLASSGGTEGHAEKKEGWVPMQVPTKMKLTEWKTQQHNLEKLKFNKSNDGYYCPDCEEGGKERRFVLMIRRITKRRLPPQWSLEVTNLHTCAAGAVQSAPIPSPYTKPLQPAESPDGAAPGSTERGSKKHLFLVEVLSLHGDACGEAIPNTASPEDVMYIDITGSSQTAATASAGGNTSTTALHSIGTITGIQSTGKDAVCSRGSNMQSLGSAKSARCLLDYGPWAVVDNSSGRVRDDTHLTNPLPRTEDPGAPVPVDLTAASHEVPSDAFVSLFGVASSEGAARASLDILMQPTESTPKASMDLGSQGAAADEDARNLPKQAKTRGIMLGVAGGNPEASPDNSGIVPEFPGAVGGDRAAHALRAAPGPAEQQARSTNPQPDTVGGICGGCLGPMWAQVRSWLPLGWWSTLVGSGSAARLAPTEARGQMAAARGASRHAARSSHVTG